MAEKNTTLTDMQFTFIAHAIANGTKIKIGDETIDGSKPYTFGDLKSYYQRIANPGPSSKAILTTAQMVAATLTDGALAPVTLDKGKFGDLLRGGFLEEITACYRQGMDVDGLTIRNKSQGTALSVIRCVKSQGMEL